MYTRKTYDLALKLWIRIVRYGWNQIKISLLIVFKQREGAGADKCYFEV